MSTIGRGSKVIKEILKYRVDKALSDAIHWLQAEQPDNAEISHHGIYWKADKPSFLRALRVIPAGAGARPVVVADHFYNDNPDISVFTQEELDVLREVVSAIDDIADEWNGTNEQGYYVDTVSFALATFAHPSLVNATRYKCPAGHGVFGSCDVCQEAGSRIIRPEDWA